MYYSSNGQVFVLKIDVDLRDDREVEWVVVPKVCDTSTRRNHPAKERPLLIYYLIGSSNSAISAVSAIFHPSSPSSEQSLLINKSLHSCHHLTYSQNYLRIVNPQLIFHACHVHNARSRESRSWPQLGCRGQASEPRSFSFSTKNSWQQDFSDPSKWQDCSALIPEKR